MKTTLLFCFLISVLFSFARADTPPPGTVKAKMYSGDGVSPVTVTDGAMSVNISGGGSGFTVNQGNAGSQAWLSSVTSSALPDNACQESGGHLASIDSKLSTPMPVSGTFWQATQPVSGTFWQGTQPVSLATLPALTTGSATIGAVNVNGTVPVSGSVTVSGTVTANAGSGTFTVDGSGHTQPVSGTFWQATQPVSGTFWQATQPVSLASAPLPSGAATEATLDDVLTAVSSINTKTPALGQALAAASTPVVLTAAQVSTLTPPTTITANAGTGTFTVDGSGHTQPVSGTVTANAGSGTFTVDASGFTVPVSGTFWQATQPVSGTVTANAGSGTFAVSGTVTANAGTGTFTVDGSGHTQPVSGTVTANIGTTNGLALDASVTALQVAQASTTSGQSGSLVQGAVTTAAPSYTNAKTSPFSLTTAGALRIDGSGSTQPVSGTFWQATQPVSGTFWQATQPVSLATLPSLVAGSAVIGKVSIDQTTPGTTNLVALAANQSVNLAQVAGTTTSTGNGTSDAGTQRVAIASNNTAFSVNATPVVPTATTVKQAAVTIGTSAVRLTTDGLAPSSTRTLLVAQLISSSTANCFFGSSGVTSSSTTRGVQMLAGQTFSFNNDAGDYYAICDASSQTFLITEQE